VRELVDCHIHTQRCGHATGTVDEYVRAAVHRGLGGICITEHLALPEEFDPNNHLSMPACDLEDYLVEVDLARQRFPEIDVVAGLEADFLLGRETETALAIADARERSDGARMVLGSVHFIGTWAFDDPHHVEEWDSRDIDGVWLEYFDLWRSACASHMFDVMAHPDLPKKFGHRPTFDTRELYLDAAATAADAGVAIEVSTAGLRKPVGELYPAHDLLVAFREAGVPATVGSDAHDPSEVGYEIPAAYDALLAAGYTGVLFPDGAGGWRTIQL
jgi:histidinol-phosphatase (PHP family)